MTWVDLVVLGVLAVSALLAFMRGLVREVLGLAAWIGAVLVAFWALPKAKPQFEQWFGTAPWVAPVTWGVLFLIAVIVLLLAAHWIGRFTRRSVLGGLDRTLGLVFGLARGAALVVLAYYIVGLVVPVAQWPGVVLRARSLDPAYLGANWTMNHLPPTGFHMAPVYPPPDDRTPSAEALMHATPQGSAIGKQPAH
jgi:membrane protein required for colicin V production